MRIPKNSKERAEWAAEVIKTCTTSRSQRIERGIAFRNLFLTGSEDGVPQTFLRTQDFICDVLAVLYSPSGLRFRVEYFGQVAQAERAKGSAAASYLLQRIVEGDIDDNLTEVVKWALVKGKTINQIVWSRGGPESYLIQPEAFGVFNESISDLRRQEAFVHSTFPTRSRFIQIISGLPVEKQIEIMKTVNALQADTRQGSDSVNNTLKQIIVGGLYPYQASGASPATQTSGTVTHLFSPQPHMQATQIEQLVPMDELWVWNNEQDDWATITMVGDMIIFGEHELFNAFSHDIQTERGISDKNNPLQGQHGFTEFSPMPLDGYFWGISYVYLVALLQYSINRRIDGINRKLRLEEDPPRYISGTTAVNQNAYAKLNKPGGYFTDSSPNAKLSDLAKEVPGDIWRSFHELNGMFDIIGGFPPIMQGQGEGSVRSQGQSDTLLRTGAARHLDAALKIERSVERVGGLIFDMMRAKDNQVLVAWVPPGVKSDQIDMPKYRNPLLEPPAPGMEPISFSCANIDEKAKIAVDSHSASPAFRHEQRELAFALAKIGAASPARVVEMVHPPMEDELLEDIERKQIAEQQLLAAHPELLEKAAGKHKK